MERNLQLDYLKILLSILVVAIHIPITANPELNNLIKNGISRISVPTFLIINGYFISKYIFSFQSVKGIIIRLLKIYLVWMIIYLPFFYNDFTLSKIINGYIHLWYLPHLALSVLMLYFLKRLNIANKYLIIFLCFLFLSGYLLQIFKNLGLEFVPESLNKDAFTRNFLFFCFPFLYLGYSIRYHDFWSRILRYKYLFVFIGLLILYLESIVLGMNNKYFSQDIYLGCLIVSPFLFLIFKDKKLVRTSTDFFSNIYIAIYLVQYLVINIFDIFFFDMFNVTVKFFLVLVLILLLSTLVVLIDRRLKFLL